LVYLYLERCSNNSDGAFPSYATIAEKCEIDRKTAIRIVDTLQRSGLVIKYQRRNKDGSQTSNIYELCDPPGEAANTTASGGIMPLPTSSGGLMPLGVVASDPQGGGLTPPYKELLINNQDINNHHHHPISDRRSVADRASGKNDDDDDDAHNQNQKGPAVKSEAGRKLPAEPEPGERREVQAPKVRPANPEGDLEPNARELIAELVSEYRETVPPEKHCKDDNAFIERLYCEFGGYCDVYLGINELGYRVAAGLTPRKPLVYLRSIIASKPWENKTQSKPQPGYSAGLTRTEREKRITDKEEKYKDIYLS
jgi:hypothetical protein